MQNLRKLSILRVLGILAIMALVVAACTAAPTTAPAATTDTEAPAEPAAATGDLPAEPGRGTDGTATLLYWQPVSLLNNYLSGGTKESHGASLIIEPLMRINPAGEFVPTLVTEVPTVENGGVAEDLTSITYNLLPDVVWSDGTPFTSSDVVFTWEYCTHPDTGCAQATNFAGVTSVEALDDLTVRVNFDSPRPYPYSAFVTMTNPILQRAQFADCVGEAAQSCSEANTAPIGTGPYKVKEFIVNDTVVYEVNENYRVPNQPHFQEVVLTAAADAAAAARAVLETNEADYAWNLQVEPQILNAMLDAGNGELMGAYSGNVERILFNRFDVSPEAGDLRGEYVADGSNDHPFLSDIRVRQAMSMAIDRQLITDQLYGAGGTATCNVLSGPPIAVSTTNDGCLVQDIEGANALLDEAGYLDTDGDGVREANGVPMQVLFQTSTNTVRQLTQALVQQWWSEIGIATDLKNVDAGVYFGSDPASPDTYGKFWADVEMFTATMSNPDPDDIVNRFLCNLPSGESNLSSVENQWLGNNIERWCNEEYDALYAEFASATGETRYEIAKQLNDMIAAEHINAPLVFRASVSARNNALGGVDMNGWDSEEWNIQEWFRVR